MILLEIYLMGLLTTFVYMFLKLTSHKRWMMVKSDTLGYFAMGIVNLLASAVCSVTWPIMLFSVLMKFDSIINEACDAIEKGE